MTHVGAFPLALLSAEDLHHGGPLLVLAVVLLAGLSFGALARGIGLPGITGQILVGMLLGKAGLDLVGEEALEELSPLTHFALGLMAVTVGAHLSLRRLRNAGRRLVILLLLEATITPALVFGAVWGIGGEPPGLAALMATCAIATAPATVVAVVREARAKGVFVKTLVAAVALNNMACIFLFEVARAFARAPQGDGTGWQALLGPTRQLLVAIAIGGLLAVVLELATRHLKRKRVTTGAVLSLVLASGTASYLEVSPLLACLFLGFVQTNITLTRDKLVDSVFDEFQPVILAAFFTLAGMHLSFEHAALAGVLSALVFGARALGKLASGTLAMVLAHATAKVRRNLGPGLLPQAGLAVALVILVQEDPAFADVEELFSAVILTVVTVNEIVGPLALRRALVRAGEANMDRLRLIDFLQEENILTDFAARTKEEAIERLVDLMISSHHMVGVDRNELLRSVLDREAQASTCLGGGLSVPHGILPSGQPMVGVMALSRAGLDFPTPDGRPVHCMVLLGTSPEERDRHLQVLSTLARTIGTDEEFQAQLLGSKNPAHASELLHGEESVNFNYFLEDDARSG